MQAVREQLEIKTLRWKIEQRHLQRIGHVIRLPEERTTKIAALGWLSQLEAVPKIGKSQGTLHSIGKPLREAGIDAKNLDALATDIKKGGKVIGDRMHHLADWEQSMANHKDDYKESPTCRNTVVKKKSLTCQHWEALQIGRGTGDSRQTNASTANQEVLMSVLRESLQQPQYERTTRRPAKASQNETEKKQFKICKTWIENSNSARHKSRHADDSGEGES